jgi:hypothetical protein
MLGATSCRHARLATPESRGASGGTSFSKTSAPGVRRSTKKILAFVSHYGYAPDEDLSRVSNELYQEAIATVIALKNVKVRWIAPELNT